jgi:hypothetical protein
VCWRSLDVPALEGGVSDMFVSFFMEVRCTKGLEPYRARFACPPSFLTSRLFSFRARRAGASSRPTRTGAARAARARGTGVSRSPWSCP